MTATSTEGYAGLRAGFGVRDITPPLGIPNVLGVDVFVGEIWDPLLAIALVLEDDSTRACIVGLDLCGLLEEPHRRFREAVAKAIDCSPDAVILNSSHTHSAPYISTEVDALLKPLGYRNTDDAYVEQLETAIVQAAVKAALMPWPVRVSAGRARVDHVGANRRPVLHGKTVHRQGRPPDREIRALPEGLIDPEVAVLAFTDEMGPSGCIFSYACHPTAASEAPHSWVSADYVGAARDLIQPRIDDMPALFLQGCGGNVGTGKYVEGTPAEDVTRLGNRLANSVARVLDRLEPVKLGPLQVGRRLVPLTLDPFPPLAEMEASLRAAASPVATPVARAELTAIADALVVARRAEEFRHAPVTVVASGDLAIVSLPGEVFVEHGLAIRADSPFPWTVVTAYNDNSLQYIPTASAFSEGAYEVDGGWRYISPGSGEALAEGAISLLLELRAGPA